MLFGLEFRFGDFERTFCLEAGVIVASIWFEKRFLRPIFKGDAVYALELVTAMGEPRQGMSTIGSICVTPTSAISGL